MNRFLSLCLILSGLTACDVMNNRLDQVALVCGEDALRYSNARFIQPQAETQVSGGGEGASWQAITETAGGFELLPRSSRGCLIVEEEKKGSLYLRHDSVQLGASQPLAALEPGTLHPLNVGPSDPQLYAQVMNLSCGAQQSNQFAISYGIQQQPAPQLHLYRVAYDIFADQGSQIPLSSGEVDARAGAIELPRVLGDGAYTIRYRLYDAFENIFAAVAPQTISCPLYLDTKAPELLGLSETLATLASGNQRFQEVAPGQALNLRVADRDSALAIEVCSAPLGAPLCDNFVPLKGPFYAPKDGLHVIRYFARDAAGNQSPISELPPIAVVHRDIMDNVGLELAAARLEAGQGNAIEANLNWLRAYESYEKLTLPLEREPLASPLGLAYSEIARGQSLQASLRDHLDSIDQLLEIPALPPQLAGHASLDKRGDLKVRATNGKLLLEAQQVSDIAWHPRLGLLISYRDGRYQLGLAAEARAFPSAFKALRLELAGDQLLAASAEELALFRLESQDLRLVWRRSLSALPIALSLDTQAGLGVLAAADSLLSFDLITGSDVSSQTWNKACTFSQLIHADAYGWYIGLKTGPRPPFGEEFHCNLHNWNGREAWQEVDPLKVHREDDFMNEPGDFRFEEINALVYLPAQQWLAFGRAIDARFALLDLREQKVTIIESYPESGEETAVLTSISLSSDGLYLADSKFYPEARGGKTTTRVWEVARSSSPLTFQQDALVKSFSNKTQAITHLLIANGQKRLISADQNRQVTLVHLNDLLLPLFSSDLKVTPFSSSIDSDLLLLKGSTIERRTRFGDLLLQLEAPAPRVTGLTVDRNNQLLALDAEGKLWQARADSRTWNLVFTTDLALGGEETEVRLLASPTRDRLMVHGQGEDETFYSLILAQDSDGSWRVQGRIEGAVRNAAWNAPATHIALLNEDSQSLFEVDGQPLASRAHQGDFGPVYLPFSADGSRWLTLSSQKIEVFDIASKAFLAESLSWPNRIQFLSFAGQSLDRLWINASNAGLSRTRSILETDLKGTVTSDYGSLRNFVRLVFAREGQIWYFDADGNVGTLRAGQDPSIQVAAPMSRGEVLLGFSPAADFLLTQGSEAESSQSPLHLSEDKRMLHAMCSWLQPLLEARQSPAIAQSQAFCASKILAPLD